MKWQPKKHLAPEYPNHDHESLCNVKARRWLGKKLVKTAVIVVGLEAFRTLPFSEQCGRCLLAQCARDGTPVIRQR